MKKQVIAIALGTLAGSLNGAIIPIKDLKAGPLSAEALKKQLDAIITNVASLTPGEVNNEFKRVTGSTYLNKALRLPWNDIYPALLDLAYHVSGDGNILSCGAILDILGKATVSLPKFIFSQSSAALFSEDAKPFFVGLNNDIDDIAEKYASKVPAEVNATLPSKLEPLWSGILFTVKGPVEQLSKFNTNTALDDDRKKTVIAYARSLEKILEFTKKYWLMIKEKL